MYSLDDIPPLINPYIHPSLHPFYKLEPESVCKNPSGYLDKNRCI